MAPQGRRELIKSQSQPKKFWYGILLFLVLQTAWFVFLIGKLISSELPVGVTESGRITDTVIASMLLIIVVAAILGIYRLDKWVIIILWLMVLWAVVNLDWVSIVVNLIVAISYHYLLSRLKSESAEV
ncbi:MAG: hypothetical protein V1853_05695 [bacterium]